MSLPAPLIKSFHYSGHDGARSATRESSDFSFISVTVQMPRNFFTALGPQGGKKSQNKARKRGVSVLRSEPHLLDRFFGKKKPSGLSVN